MWDHDHGWSRLGAPGYQLYEYYCVCVMRSLPLQTKKLSILVEYVEGS